MMTRLAGLRGVTVKLHGAVDSAFSTSSRSIRIIWFLWSTCAPALWLRKPLWRFERPVVARHRAHLNPFVVHRHRAQRPGGR
jgi:hypothetical protein